LIVQLRMPDELYEIYGHFVSEIAGRVNGTGTTPEDLMASQLDRFRGVPPMDRCLVVSSPVRDALEQILSGGTLRDDRDLLEKVRRLSDVRIEGIHLHFTPPQLQQVRNYCTRNGLPIEEGIRRIVREMEHRFFDFVSG
jgi:hypothetical protein